MTTRKDFIEGVTTALAHYLDDFELFQPNPQLSVNPATFYVEMVSGPMMAASLDVSDQVTENEAAADGDATEDAADENAMENPDYYPVRQFLIVKEGSPVKVSTEAITALADKYFS